MTEPNRMMLADKEIPTIDIDGRKWPIPRLAIKQLKVVVPMLMARLPQMRNGGAVGNLTAEAMDDLFTIVYTGLTRAHPAMTRDEFDNMIMSFDEMLAAVVVVQQQTKSFVPPKSEQPAEAPGEAPVISPTGTP
jgi:hypothetical protein